MRAKKTIKEPAERLERRKFLFELEAQIDSCEESEFTATQLQSLNIDVQHMSLDATSDSKPIFFAPHPNVHEPTNDDLAGRYEALRCKDDFTTPPVTTTPEAYAQRTEISLSTYAANMFYEDLEIIKWCWKDPGDYRSYKSLDDFAKPTFGTFRVMDIRGRKFPHIKAVAFQDLPGNEQTITSGELLIVLRLMFTQMRQSRLIKHMIAPVFLVSLLGTNVRAIESYYDGNHFVLRRTPFFRIHDQDFRDTLVSFKTITEWYMGDAIGVTL